MKNTLSLLTLLAASAAFAQTAPAVDRKPQLQHSVEAAYLSSSSKDGGFDDIEGYNLSARAYVWQNVFVALEYYTGMTDTVFESSTLDVDISRFGYGLGATFQVGAGQLSASYTLGELELEIESYASGKIDQERANLTYTHTLGNGVTASLGVTQFMNEQGGDLTAVILGLGYDFRNGLSVFATYSPESSDIGSDEFSEDAISLGARYSF